MNEEDALKAFAALSQPTRMRILQKLVRAGTAGLAAGDIGREVGARGSAVSFHLSNLENAGLIDSERRSRHIIYTANFPALGQLVTFLLEDCCNNDPAVAASCFTKDGCC